MFKLKRALVQAVFVIASMSTIGLAGCTTSSHIEETSIPSDFRQVVPIAIVAKRWILPVVINNEHLNLMLDTGSTQVALFENNRTQTFFENADSFTQTRAFDENGPSVKSKFFKNATLNMDGFPEQNIHITLLGLDQNPLFMYKIDGLIGYELLSKYDVRIDNQTKSATFMKGGALKPLANKHHFPIKLIGKIPTFKGMVRFPGDNEKEKLPMKVDTGANFSILIFMSKEVKVNSDAATETSTIMTVSGVEKYTKIPEVSITSLNGIFSYTSAANVKRIENVDTRGSIGMPALVEDIVEISYTSKFISAGDKPTTSP